MVGKLKVAKGLKVTVKVNEYQSLELSRGTSHSILKRLSADPPLGLLSRPQWFLQSVELCAKSVTIRKGKDIKYDQNSGPN
jgi:hypothetical protein